MTDTPIILSEKFSAYNEIKFGFSTRKGGTSPEPFGMNLSFNVEDERLNVLKNREIFFSSLHIGLDELAIPRQVQGGLVRRVYVQGGYDACDGLITNSYGVFLTVSSADCLPVFLFDPVNKAVGAVHAVIEKKMDKLKVATVGNPAMCVPSAMGPGLPTWMGAIPGMSWFATGMMKKEMEKIDIPPVREFIEMIHDAGCEIYACKATVDMYHLTKKDFCPQVDDIISVGQFYEKSAGASIIFT